SRRRCAAVINSSAPRVSPCCQRSIHCCISRVCSESSAIVESLHDSPRAPGGKPQMSRPAIVPSERVTGTPPRDARHDTRTGHDFSRKIHTRGSFVRSLRPVGKERPFLGFLPGPKNGLPSARKNQASVEEGAVSGLGEEGLRIATWIRKFKGFHARFRG